MQQIKHIRLDKIKPPEFDTRLGTNDTADKDLADSIKEIGLLEPLIVKEIGDGYEIIAGNRRFNASGRAGLAAVPCIVVKTTGAMTDKIALHENIKRLPLSHVDQAYTFAHLIKQYNMTESDIATLVGKSIAYVSQHLSLLQSDETLVQSVHDGRINFSVARELMQCKDEDDRARLQHIIEENGATTSVVKSWVNESNKETDLLNDETPPPSYEETPSRPHMPYYPCAACEVPTPVNELKTVRLCPDCFYMIFQSIEHEKYKQRTKQQQQDTKFQ